MAPAPWEAVSPSEQLFVLVTGANSGVGLAACQRIIDEFLSSRSLTAHLILIPTTRSVQKSLDTIRTLREHVASAARSSTALQSRAGPAYRWQDTVARVHVVSPQLDLCDLRNVRALARQLCTGTLSNPEGLEGEYLRDVRIPKLDSVYLNAAYGNWVGVNYPLAIWTMLTTGLVQVFTWPSYYNIKLSQPTSILNEKPRYKYPLKPLLGEVFCACFFGHYLFVHNLLPLLSRRLEDNAPPGRIIWASSVEATRKFLDTSDIQSLNTEEPYESVKRLCDVLTLTTQYPAVQPIAESFFRANGAASKQKLIPPKMYTTHCGIVFSGLFPVPWFFMWAYNAVLFLCRILGSPWHNLQGYIGAKAAAFIVLQEQAALDEAGIDRVKLGSCTDRMGRDGIKLTEVEDYGWEGKVETPQSLANDNTVGIYKKSVGRRGGGVENMTEDNLIKFQELGAECWKQVEDMRVRWEAILDAEENQSS
ncbi:3-keto-steroid reductase [Paramyrothecium foliicola]|nr:3-keto-steroid reductase [Paramyrothecium foliicola]